ncbi:MAG: methyltransferase [Roseiflexus sp.]|nr:methyltransferase [Roseiflexus sp.]MCS7287757.1 methyltransferase [Roseiflexus sp.]MDW8233178.1 methyltransferase [Roseiflexaceae bacterium]
MTISNKRFRQQIIEAVQAGEPVAPRCSHAPPLGQCGGCVFQDRAYPAQVAAKRAALRSLWSNDLPDSLNDALDVVASPNPFAYRTRMDFVASKERFGLRRSGRFNYIVDLRECHLMPAHAFAAARFIYEHAVALGLPDYDLRTHTGFLRYVVVRRSPDDELLLALVTTAPEEKEVVAEKVERVALAALKLPGVLSVHWLINATRTDVSFGESAYHWGRATLPMRVGAHTLEIGPNSFFQNNVWLLMPLLDAVRNAVAAGGHAGVIADLYSGVGTIALHVADCADRIVCVELVGESARLARDNSARAGHDHIIVVESNVVDALRAQAIGAFDVVVADPPRTGLGPEVCRELLRLRPRRIVYVSCNPLTQRDDIHALLSGYRLASLQGYDMFPQTPHLESLAVLDIKG